MKTQAVRFAVSLFVLLTLVTAQAISENPYRYFGHLTGSQDLLTRIRVISELSEVPKIMVDLKNRKITSESAQEELGSLGVYPDRGPDISALVTEAYRAAETGSTQALEEKLESASVEEKQELLEKLSEDLAQKKDQLARAKRSKNASRVRNLSASIAVVSGLVYLGAAYLVHGVHIPGLGYWFSGPKSSKGEFFASWFMRLLKGDPRLPYSNFGIAPHSYRTFRAIAYATVGGAFLALGAQAYKMVFAGKTSVTEQDIDRLQEVIAFTLSYQAQES